MPTIPGIWKRKIDSDTLDERRTWREALEKSGFCYYRHPTKAELYFSNAFNVAHGYPPTADLLGYPKLLLEGPEVEPEWCDQDHLGGELARRAVDRGNDRGDDSQHSSYSSASDEEEEECEGIKAGAQALFAGLGIADSFESEHEECGGQ